TRGRDPGQWLADGAVLARPAVRNPAREALRRSAGAARGDAGEPERDGGERLGLLRVAAMWENYGGEFYHERSQTTEHQERRGVRTGGGDCQRHWREPHDRSHRCPSGKGRTHEEAARPRRTDRSASGARSAVLSITRSRRPQRRRDHRL